MRNFILGIVVTVVLIFAAGFIAVHFGLLPTAANVPPPDLETRIAMAAQDAAMKRQAPHIANPAPVTDENLIAGMRLYSMNCAVCHGSLDFAPSLLEHSMYPPPPQIIREPIDDPEWHIDYAVRTGVRYTGMPAWSKTLADEDIWKVTAFLSRINDLPPAVQDEWEKIYGISPKTHQGGEHKHSMHDMHQ